MFLEPTVNYGILIRYEECGPSSACGTYRKIVLGWSLNKVT